MQWSTTTSLNDLHIIDDANNIVRWHRMSQCPVCLQPIPYGMWRFWDFIGKFCDILDERRVVAGKVLHSGCIICTECHKSIGEGAYEQVELIEKTLTFFICWIFSMMMKFFVLVVIIRSLNRNQKHHHHHPRGSIARQKRKYWLIMILLTIQLHVMDQWSKFLEIFIPFLDLFRLKNRSFIERVYLYNEYNQKKTSHLTITEVLLLFKKKSMSIYFDFRTIVKYVFPVCCVFIGISAHQLISNLVNQFLSVIVDFYVFKCENIVLNRFIS
jgi:hypothetical protein